MKVLCQDCLNVREMDEKTYWKLMKNNSLEGSCFCGGDECGCGSCQQCAEMLVKPVKLDISFPAAHRFL